MRDRHKVYIGAMAAFAMTTLAVQANATPVNLTGGYNNSSGSISGTLQGDYTGNVLTLSPAPHASQIIIDLKNPSIPLPHPIFSAYSQYCVYFCTISANLNESYVLNLPAWYFDIGGSVTFDTSNPLGGTANLSALPVSPYLGDFTGTATPTFSVTADQSYGPANQFLADQAASSLQSLLNLGNWHISVDGKGLWNSIDLGTITASSTQNAGQTDIALGFSNITLSGLFGFNANVTFDNSIVNAVGSTFIDLFKNSIDKALAAGFNYGVDSLSLLDTQSGEYSADCGTQNTYYNDPAYNTWVGLSCGINATYSGSFRTLSAATVPEPATAGLFGLGLVGVILIRRRRPAT